LVRLANAEARFPVAAKFGDRLHAAAPIRPGDGRLAD
jgi:hypothetical protein